MNEKIDLVLRIIAWGLITAALFIIFLKSIGIIYSPFETFVNTLITAGVLIELGRIETKLGLLWNDFKRRKRI